MCGYPVDKVEDPGAVGELDVLLAEVQLQFHEGDDVQHLGAHLLELRGIAAAQLLQGNVVGGVHPAVQEGPFGKFTGGGHLGPCGYQRPQYLGDNVLGAMTIYLGGVLPGIGVGSPEDRGHDLVDDGLRSIPLRENDPSVVHFPCPEFRRPNAAFLLHRPVHPLQSFIGRYTLSSTVTASGPLMRSTAIAPCPGAVALAHIVVCSYIVPLSILYFL